MLATFPYCSRCEALTVRGTYFCGAVKVSLVLPKPNLQATHQVFWKQTNKQKTACKPDPWGLQNTRAPELFSSSVHQLLLPSPNYCTSEREIQSTQPVEMYAVASLNAPHWSQEGSLVIWRFCHNARRHEIPPTKHRLRYVSVALTLHLSFGAFQVVF